MAKRLALVFLTIAPFAILSISFLDSRAATMVFASVVMAFPIALITLAVSRAERLGTLRGPLLALFVMLQTGAIGVLAFDGAGTIGPFGFPLSLHFLLLLLWLGPLFVTTLAYAATFSELGIDDELMQRLVQLRRRRRSEEELR